MPLALLAAALCAHDAWAQTTIAGDAWFEGPVMVGTDTASGARVNITASSTTSVPFQVSGVDLTPFLRVGPDGKVGLSAFSAANVDVNGSGDNGAIALQVRGGNLYPATSGRAQITFGQDGTADRRHHIDSVHVDSTSRNALDFLIWTPDAGTTSLASMTVLSLVTISTAAGASVHVRPAGAPIVELTVSNGNGLGLGTIHAASQVTPSSREWKSDIAYLDAAEAADAYERVHGLKHVAFRYARRKRNAYSRDGKAPARRGLIYEDAPASLRGPGESLSLTRRLTDSELAFIELTRRLESFADEVGR